MVPFFSISGSDFGELNVGAATVGASSEHVNDVPSPDFQEALAEIEAYDLIACVVGVGGPMTEHDQ